MRYVRYIKKNTIEGDLFLLDIASKVAGADRIRHFKVSINHFVKWLKYAGVAQR